MAKRRDVLAGVTSLAVVLSLQGCANVIRTSDDVIWDRVEGTEELKIEERRFVGAVAEAKLRFVCQRRQFAVTNVYETPYGPWNELYEVPVGLVAIVPSFVWYLGSSLLTLGAVNPEIARGPIYWSASGLNPAMNVENGMWSFLGGDVYRIREKGGSRRPQEGSKPEPYDATVSLVGGVARVRFQRPDNRRGSRRTVHTGEEILIEINLLEAAPAIQSPDADRVEVTAKVKWSPEAKPLEKSFTILIPSDLARKLYDVREQSRLLQEGNAQKSAAAYEALLAAGFEREARLLSDARGRKR